MARYVITGTGTEIGKTVFAAGLCALTGAAYWKPIQTGTVDGTSDSASVAELSGARVHPPAWALPEPLSPHRAAELAGAVIDPDALVPPDGPLVIEGAGGVLVPITRGLLSADLFARWDLPVVLVCTTGLGTISHSLTAIEALRVRGCRLHGLAFVGEDNPDNIATIAAFSGARVLGRLPHLPRLDRASLRAAMTAGFHPQDFAGQDVGAGAAGAGGGNPPLPAPPPSAATLPTPPPASPRKGPDMSAVWYPFFQHGTEPPPPAITHAEGARLTTADGRVLIDAISSWWVTTHGHRYPPIMAAIREATEGLDQIIFSGLTHAPAEAVAERLVALAPAGLTRVFFSDSGSTSVEVALKMALGYWVHTGRPRHRIAVLDGSYHGDTIGTMSVGARGVFNAPYAPLLFDVTSLPCPAADPDACLTTFDALAAGGQIAALIVEPLVLGAGGMVMYPPQVLAGLADIARRHGVLLIADEVMTGWGRTGTLWACDQAKVAPDILCTSKGLTGGSLPLAATLASEAIFAAHASTDRSRMFFHSSSYTANPIACAAALANLEVWRTEPVADRIETLCARQAAHLAALAGDARFQNPRRCGTIAALDLKVPAAGYLAEAGPAMRAHGLAHGVLIRPLGSTVYVLPPYCITEAELAQVWDVIASFDPAG